MLLVVAAVRTRPASQVRDREDNQDEDDDCGEHGYSLLVTVCGEWLILVWLLRVKCDSR